MGARGWDTEVGQKDVFLFVFGKRGNTKVFPKSSFATLCTLNEGVEARMIHLERKIKDTRRWCTSPWVLRVCSV